MDDKAKIAMGVIDTIISHVLDGVATSIESARDEIRENPLCVPSEFKDCADFRIAADFGLFVAKSIVGKINEKFRGEERVVN